MSSKYLSPTNHQPTQLSDPGVTPPLRGILKIPHYSATYPGVVLLTGSSGWQAAYADIAASLAESGFVALAVDYLAETGVNPSPENRLQHWSIWQAIVGNAVSYLQANPSVTTRPIGLVGYSLGAFLAVSVASKLPQVKAVVDFFGGGGRGMESLDEEVRNIPPLLILHGEADSIVPVSLAYSLRDAVIAQGGEVEMHVYPGAQHGFNAPWSPWFSALEASDSLTRMIDFLGRRLGQ